MVAEMAVPENEGALLLERLLGTNATWSPKGSRVDPYRGVDEWVRNWMWYHIRDFVLERDSYTCQMCGEYVKGKAQIHHIVWKCHNGTDHPKNLMVVCEGCHKKIHARELPLIMLQ